MAMRVSATLFGDPDAIAHIDALIANDPDDVRLRFARACALEDLGRTLDAQRAYLDVLARDPQHFGSLTNLGSLLHVRGQCDVAMAFYLKAVAAHPDDPMGHINLGNGLVEMGDIEAGKSEYETALRLRPGYPNAHFALSLLHRSLGDDDLALRNRQLAFAKPSVRVAPYYGADPPLDVLFVVSADGGNVVTHPYIDQHVIRAYNVIAEGYRPELELPPHHVFFNAIGDADRAAEPLRIAAEIAKCSG